MQKHADNTDNTDYSCSSQSVHRLLADNDWIHRPQFRALEKSVSRLSGIESAVIQQIRIIGQHAFGRHSDVCRGLSASSQKMKNDILLHKNDSYENPTANGADSICNNTGNTQW